MNDIFNIVIHVAFLFIGLGAGFAAGIVTQTGKGLALDLRDAIERRIESRTHKRPKESLPS